MPFKLISSDGTQSFELRDGMTMVVGRAVGSDIPLFDPTISRRHAELECDAAGVRLRDLGSSNGTFVNGARVDRAQASTGDTVSFGTVAFRVHRVIAPLEEPTVQHVDARPPTPGSGATIVRERALGEPAGTLSQLLRTADLQEGPAAAPLAGAHERTEEKLALLLEVSKALSRAVDVDALLDKIAGFVFRILDVDRVAIMLVDEHGGGELVPKISRDRRGTHGGRAVPQSIARKVVADRVAVLSANAPEDQRFSGESIVAQNVRSAMCAPLVAGEAAVQGVLYVDNLTTAQVFDDEDLDFLIAFSSIAAVAIENSKFAERIRREALVRSNFERYFAPNLAARIAEAQHAVRPGGEKRRVAVLFSDIRGFTTLSATMTPHDVAQLLSEYFTVMVECVFRHGGTLDKFIGDAVMAQWGAPLAAPDDADRAMRAALGMLAELRLLNERWRTQKRPELQVGIGLNVGDVFAGNIGSERRLEFTVIGDAVNIASRLCAAAEGGEILITDEMRAALRDPPPMRERATLELKGTGQLVSVYSITG